MWGSAIHGRTFKQNLRVALSRCSHHSLQHVLAYLFAAVVLYQSKPIREQNTDCLYLGRRQGLRQKENWGNCTNRNPGGLCSCDDCTVLHCTALHCTALYCTVLHSTALYCTVLRARNCIWAMNWAAQTVRRKSKTLRQYKITERILYSSMFPGGLSFCKYTNLEREN
jgi:hypothetical protein